MKPNTVILSVPEVKKKFTPLFKTINRTTILPILEYITISPFLDSINCSATDLESVVSINLKVQHSLTQSFCIQSYYLKHLLSNCISETITLTFEDGKVSVVDDGFELNFICESIDKFPKQPVLTNAIDFVIDSEKLIDLLNKSIGFVSADDLRPAMTGVCLYDYNGRLHAVATDAHRLIWLPLMDTPEIFKGKQFIIPQKSVRLILSLFKDGKATILLDIDHCQINQPGKNIVFRTIDANYPDFSKVIPNHTESFDLKRKNLVSFLNLAEPFTNKSTGEVKVVVRNQKIEIWGRDTDFLVSFNYALPIYNSTSKQTFNTAFSIKLIKQLLRINANDEYVHFEHSGSPTKAIGVDGCSLLMPLMTT